jgi:hypothetical protein
MVGVVSVQQKLGLRKLWLFLNRQHHTGVHVRLSARRQTLEELGMPFLASFLLGRYLEIKKSIKS